MRRIGVLTSGGDSPGINAAIRAVVRSAIARGCAVTGYRQGFDGLIHNETIELKSTSVGGIISRGGTVLRTARSEEFRKPEGRAKAAENLRTAEVEGLVVIGGDGSLTGALRLSEEQGIAVMGIPGTIDNDISGTDFSIGFDTAVNTAMDAIDKVRDTAYSHDRVFVIEVMGRANGFIAVEVALSCGAEAVIIPEIPYSLKNIVDGLRAARDKGKNSSIIVVSEGAARSADIKEFIQKQTGFETRFMVLGHMQRGGSPTAFDRVLALRLGHFAANRLVNGYSSEMVGLAGGRLVSHPLTYVLSAEKTIEAEKLQLVDVMAG